MVLARGDHAAAVAELAETRCGHDDVVVVDLAALRGES
jgi:hypothetical protein